MVTGTLQDFNLNVYALLDPGATISVVNPSIQMKFDVSPETLSEPFLVSIPVGDLVIARRVYKLESHLTGSCRVRNGRL